MNSLPAQLGLAMTWITDPADMETLRDEWEALAERVGADIYMRPDWFVVWWRHFGCRRRLACAVARLDGALVGVLPFALERHWQGPVPMQIARLAGSDPNCIIFQLPLDPVWAAPILQQAVGHLVRIQGCAAVSFTPVSDLACHLTILLALPGQDQGLTTADANAGSHVVFDLPDRFDLYLESLTKKRRGQFRRDVTGLQDTFGMITDHIVPDGQTFDDFVAFHNQQWQAVGRGGHFGDWPDSAAFYRDLAEQTPDTKMVQLDRMKGIDATLAAEFSLVAGATLHWRLPARALNPDAERLSAGKIIFVLMFKRLIEQGIFRVEAGRGKYSYKLDYGGRNVAVHRLIVSPATAFGRLRLKLLLSWSDLLDLLYYRIWFQKIAPRYRKLTGAKPRPLWRCWIRTRL